MLGFPRVVNSVIITTTRHLIAQIPYFKSKSIRILILKKHHIAQKMAKIQVLRYWKRIVMLAGLDIFIVQHFVGLHLI